MSKKCEISFYHLSKYSVIKALPKLLEKVYQSGANCLVVCSNDSEMAALNEMLWTYGSKAFLPHGSTEDQDPSLQPILLSTNFTRLNDAKIIVILAENIPENIDEFERCLDIFYSNGVDEPANKANSRYKFYKDNNHPLTYWIQDSEGAWVKR